MEPEGPPPWTSSEPGEGVFGGGEQKKTEPAAVRHGPEPIGHEPAGRNDPTAGEPHPPPDQGAAPPAPPSGAPLLRGIFLYLATTSLISGIIAVLSGARAGNGTTAAILGIAFVVLLFVAVMLRPGPAMDPVRASLGIAAVVFLVACFVLAVGATDQSVAVDTGSELVRAAAAAGLFTLGMAGIAAIIPSAVAAGLAMPGLVATVVLASAAAGARDFELAVAGVIAAVAALELAFHAPRLRSHPGATAWMVNLGGLVTGIAATTLGVSFRGTAVASAGLAGAALAVIAWRRRAVVAAAAAVVPLSLVEGWAASDATGGDGISGGVVILLVGLVLLVLVGLAGLRIRAEAAPTARRGGGIAEEVLLVAAAAMALVALSEVGGGGSPFFGPTGPFGGSGGSTQPLPVPTLQFPTPPPG